MILGGCPLQDQWAALKAKAAGVNEQDGSTLLQVIANAAATFPAAESKQLASDLEQVMLDKGIPGRPHSR